MSKHAKRDAMAIGALALMTLGLSVLPVSALGWIAVAFGAVVMIVLFAHLWAERQ